MLWGAALVALPILIHLLNRRRYVVVPFAAMSFLLAAFKSRRRRLRMENLLLLLLRCLLVLLAALAMALPFVPEDSPLAALSGGRRELVLINTAPHPAWFYVDFGTGRAAFRRTQSVSSLPRRTNDHRRALLLVAPESVAFATLGDPRRPRGGPQRGTSDRGGASWRA